MNKIKKIIAFLTVSLLIFSATSCTDIASENESDIPDNTTTINDNLNISDDKSSTYTDITSENKSDIPDNITTTNDNLNTNDDKSNMIASPISSDKIKGSDYSKIINEFSDAGFTNIHTEKIEDLIIGFLVSDGEIEEISINGNTKFNKTDYFPPDAEIIIKYHTFPENKEDETKNKIEKEADKIRNETDNKADEIQILNESNCPELYNVLHAVNENDPIHGQFAAKYVNQIIEFDGYTADAAPHGSYKTRFDFLILYGDYYNETLSGPYFQFRDVNYNDLHLKGANIPDSFGAGLNIHIVAKIVKYEEISGLFLLEPVEIYMR